MNKSIGALLILFLLVNLFGIGHVPDEVITKFNKIVLFVALINFVLMRLIQLIQPLYILVRIFWPGIIGLALGVSLISTNYFFVGVTIIGISVFLNLLWLVHLDIM